MLILLLLACIIVGAMLLLNGDNESYSRESLEKAAELMAKSGITVDSEQLLGDFEGMRLYRFTLPQDYPEKLAETLTVGKVTDIFTLPNGVEMRTDAGERLFVGSDFTVNYNLPSANHGFSEDEIEALLVPPCQSPEFGVQRVETEQNSESLIFIQTLGSFPIPQNEITCNFVDGKLSSFEGKWCFPDKCSTFSAQLRDYLNIMFTERERISADAENRKNLTVKKLEKCYGIESTESKTSFILVPSLNIIYKEAERAIHSAVVG